ncbi:hypothetical protein Moror_3803 [Moniliophthora roreri MCA 2997]|uniref:Uncharacterized protein n=1 Tax=Moniliophthora roreri (strain MCA 2997) TaxID=1381753 RepID=V2WVN4_MONRO|nr:hypothetical protein Moror_3803 [Moniliophthora roreri MCA 2997]
MTRFLEPLSSDPWSNGAAANASQSSLPPAQRQRIHNHDSQAISPVDRGHLQPGVPPTRGTASLPTKPEIHQPHPNHPSPPTMLPFPSIPLPSHTPCLAPPSQSFPIQYLPHYRYPIPSWLPRLPLQPHPDYPSQIEAESKLIAALHSMGYSFAYVLNMQPEQKLTVFQCSWQMVWQTMNGQSMPVQCPLPSVLGLVSQTAEEEVPMKMETVSCAAEETKVISAVRRDDALPLRDLIRSKEARRAEIDKELANLTERACLERDSVLDELDRARAELARVAAEKNDLEKLMKEKACMSEEWAGLTDRLHSAKGKVEAEKKRTESELKADRVAFETKKREKRKLESDLQANQQLLERVMSDLEQARVEVHDIGRKRQEKEQMEADIAGMQNVIRDFGVLQSNMEALLRKEAK